MRRTIFFLPFCILVSLLIIGGKNTTEALEHAEIDVTVTPIYVSLTVSPNQLDFGTVILGGVKSSSQNVSVANDGSVSEDFFIRGNDATCWACTPRQTWVLSEDGIGPNQYTLKYITEGGIVYNPLNHDYQQFGYIVPPLQYVSLIFSLQVPSQTSGFGQYQTKIELQALAHQT